MSNKRIILEESEVQSTIEEIAVGIRERYRAAQNLAFVGIHKRGVPLSHRVAKFLQDDFAELSNGILDIAFYRDDLHHLESNPEVRSTDIPFRMDGSNVVLFDDVLFTGRTIRAAMNALMSFGRPASIDLVVLVDRGHRELPIQAGFVGKKVESKRTDYIQVKLSEIDGVDEVAMFLDGKPN